MKKPSLNFQEYFQNISRIKIPEYAFLEKKPVFRFKVPTQKSNSRFFSGYYNQRIKKMEKKVEKNWKNHSGNNILEQIFEFFLNQKSSFQEPELSWNNSRKKIPESIFLNYSGIIPGITTGKRWSYIVKECVYICVILK